MLSVNGFSDTVALGCQPPPVGVVCQVQPSVVTPPPNGVTVAILTIIADGSVDPGIYGLDLTATSPSLSVASGLKLNVWPALQSPPHPLICVAPREICRRFATSG